MAKVAILIDGGFFLKRHYKLYPKDHFQDPEKTAKDLYTFAMSYVEDPSDELYRIFYYDCKPLEKKVHNPISGKCIDYKKSNQANFRNDFFECLKKRRKVALRLGYLSDGNRWETG